MLQTKVISTGGSNIVDKVGAALPHLLWKAAMHKALVLVLTQDTKRGVIDNSGGGGYSAVQGH